MKKILLTLSIFLFSFSYSQVSSKTQQLIKPLQNYKSFYALNEEPKEIKRKLEQSSSTEELFYLANNGENAYIKSIAVDVLVNRKENKIVEVFKNSIHSYEEITYSTECLSNSYLLSSYIFETAINNPNLSEYNKKKLIIELCSIALKSQPTNIKLLEQIRFEIPETPENYSVLRKMVIESKSSELLISLAKYKNPNDIELIKSFGENSFLAIEQFPDDRFLPFLNDNIEKSKSFHFMFAISSFCNEASKKIIEKVIEFERTENKKNNCGNGCLNSIYQQINKNNCPFFQTSLENLWLTDKIISFEVLNNYEKKNSKEKTIEFIMKGFLIDGEPEIIYGNLYNIDQISENITDDLMYDDELPLIKLLEKIKSLSTNDYNVAIRNFL